MFDRFGEFDSAEEINAKAEELFNAADYKGLMQLTKENGIPEAFAECYRQGDLPQLTDAMTAAIGKIEMEREETVLEGLLEDWISYVESECMEDEELARAVRSKKKSLKGCIAELLLESLLNQKQVDKDILAIVEKMVKERGIDLKKQTGMDPNWLKYTKIGMPGSGRAKKLIRSYYLGR